MSGFGSDSQYLLFLWINFDFKSIYSSFEQGFDEKKKILWMNSCEKSIPTFKSYSQVSGPLLIKNS